MFAKPSKEHPWLDRLVGNWSVEMECMTGPDQSPQKSTSRMTCRSLGGMWLVAEMQGEDPEHGIWSSLLTLGYDPRKEHYVGTFAGSMMDHLWLYEGSLDADQRVLTLDCEGLKFDGSGMAKYQDIIEWKNADHWVMYSQVLDDDAAWQRFMEAHYRRV